ncbi:MAG: hypothetical protein GY757_59130, partial [bacterium]|nr:hypothetical protein [bacterium]
MEYIESAFARTNGKIAKALVLFLSKERHVEKTRLEISAYLKTKGIEMEDEELDKRLRLLVKSDIIAEGSSAFQYRGIPDDLLNHVVQTRYEYEIENIKNEETAADIARQNREKRESVSQAIIEQNKGGFLEYMMIKVLKYDSQTTPSHPAKLPPLNQLIRNAPETAKFVPYESVGDYHFNLPNGHHRQFDIVAKAADPEQPSLAVECKFLKKPVDSTTVEFFAQKVQELKRRIPVLIPIFYSVSGFSQ